MTDQKPIGEGVPHADIVLTIIISCYNDRDLVADCLNPSIKILPPNPMKSFLSTTPPATGQAKWWDRRFRRFGSCEATSTATTRIRTTGGSIKLAEPMSSC